MTDVGTPKDADTHAHRELLAIREIAHALLVADRPEDVHQFALDRVTPILGAQFSMVMRLGDDGELLRPVAQHEWPLQHRAWIGALRVRVGSGPSGLAVLERRVVEIRDLFADEELADWFDVARELGFRSILAAPLVGARGVIGAIAFYFADETVLSDEQRALVRLVADQLAATVDKAALIDELRRANAALAEANAQLEHLANDAEAARIARDRFFQQVTRAISEVVSQGGAHMASRVALIAESTSDLLSSDRFLAAASDVEARAPLLATAARYRAQYPTVPIHVAEPTVMLPTIQTDARRLEHVLDLLVATAMNHAQQQDGSVQLAIELGRGFVSYRVTWPAAHVPHAEPGVEQLLARQAAHQLGGELQFERVTPESSIHDELTSTLVFPVDIDG